jgi:hypothetical protein
MEQIKLVLDGNIQPKGYIEQLVNFIRAKLSMQ